MKNYSLLLLLILFAAAALLEGCSSSKSVGKIEKIDSNEDVEIMPDVMPRFSQGNVQEWVNKHLKYPEQALKMKKEGRVMVRFIVDRDGSVTYPKVVLSSGNDWLDAEGLRVVAKMPHWSSPRKDGKKVRMYMTVPIHFHLVR